MGRADPVRYVIIYVIPEAIVLMKCNSLRYKGGLPVARSGGCPGPLENVLRGQLEGAGKVLFSRGRLERGARSRRNSTDSRQMIWIERGQVGYWCIK